MLLICKTCNPVSDLIAVGQEHHTHTHQVKYFVSAVHQTESFDYVMKPIPVLTVQSLTSMWSIIMAYMKPA